PLTREDEILAIDGIPVGELIEDVYRYFPVDGDTDFIKESSISDFGEFHGPAFEHFMPFLRNIREEAALSVRRGDGPGEDMVVARLTFNDYTEITGEKMFSSNFVDAVRYEPLGEDAAYLAVDTFINYRKPVKPDNIYGPIFKQMAKEGRTKLILDLRRNGGGSTDAQTGLVKWIIREPLQQAEAVWTRANSIDEDLKPYLSTWNKAALNPDPRWFEDLGNGYYKVISRRAGAPGGPLKPKRDAFTGELVLLTSTDNASGVTHLLAALKGAGRGTFVGEPTGGSATGATAGIIMYLNLPESGITVRVPLQRTVIANGDQFDPRLGITPDILAEDTKESFFAGADPALEAAKSFLGVTAD
ncbi:MAG: S41 family peptidase, partial [Pseudomonadota bacterium]